MIVKSMKTDREYGLSEELLAAFEEGRTDAEETRRVIEALAGDPALREEYVLSRKVDALMGGGDGMAVLPLAAMAAESGRNRRAKTDGCAKREPLCTASGGCWSSRALS